MSIHELGKLTEEFINIYNNIVNKLDINDEKKERKKLSLNLLNNVNGKLNNINGKLIVDNNNNDNSFKKGNLCF